MAGCSSNVCPKCGNPTCKKSVFCSRCGSSWHWGCAGFRRPARVSSPWVCANCSFSLLAEEESDRATGYHGAPPTASEMALYEKCHRLEGSTRTLTAKIGRLTIENDDRKNQTARLSDEVHRLRDATKCQSAAIRKLKIRQEVQNQEMYAKNAEVHNLFHRPDEDLEKAVVNLLRIQGKSIDPEDVDSCVRLPFGGAPDRPKPVVVVFKDRQRRDAAVRKRGVQHVSWGELADKLGVELKEDERRDERVYVNPHLTSHFRKLLALSRKVCGQLGIRYCWYNNNKVLIRYPEDSEDPMVIETMEDLQALSRFGPNMRTVVERELSREVNFRIKSAEKQGFQFPRSGAKRF